jgi:transposase, IS30 family
VSSSALPETLLRSLTSDQTAEMRDWKQVRIGAGIEIYFCDPRSPWQRGTDENVSGLLRQYFPKGTDLATVTALELDRVVWILAARAGATCSGL